MFSGLLFEMMGSRHLNSGGFGGLIQSKSDEYDWMIGSASDLSVKPAGHGELNGIFTLLISLPGRVSAEVEFFCYKAPPPLSLPRHFTFMLTFFRFIRFEVFIPSFTF